jgi:uncharacterized protein YxeA
MKILEICKEFKFGKYNTYTLIGYRVGNTIHKNLDFLQGKEYEIIEFNKDLTEYELKEDNSRYEYYLENPINNKYVPDIEKIKKEEINRITKKLENAVQEHIDNQAKALGYDDISSIGKYLGYDNYFRDECEKLGKFNASCWTKAFEIQERGVLITKEELISELPKYE